MELAAAIERNCRTTEKKKGGEREKESKYARNQTNIELKAGCTRSIVKVSPQKERTSLSRMWHRRSRRPRDCDAVQDSNQGHLDGIYASNFARFLFPSLGVCPLLGKHLTKEGDSHNKGGMSKSPRAV